MVEVVATKESLQRRKNQILTMMKKACRKVSGGHLSFFTSHATTAVREDRDIRRPFNMHSVAIDGVVLTPKEEVSMRPTSKLKEGGAGHFCKTKSTTNDGEAGVGTSGHMEAGGTTHHCACPTVGTMSCGRAWAWMSRWGRARLAVWSQQGGGRQRMA
jgi:hypothetical protein